MSLVSRVGTAPVGPAAPAPRTAPGAGGFALPAAMGEPDPAATAEIYPAAMAGLLALQEGVSGYRSDPAARRAGHALLGALAALQRALLEGSDGTAALARMRVLLDGMPPAEDPALAALLAPIALRCRVELARRET
ncbi:MAG: flagellar assembly protein FliX [Acetobacteraceae bacterium]